MLLKKMFPSFTLFTTLYCLFKYSLKKHAAKKSNILLIWFVTFLAGCTTTQPVNNIKQGYTSDIIKREKNLVRLTTWQVKGKIAFINSEERKSASLFWNKSNANQQLNLTTYLGINVLKLTSDGGIHTIEVDGETYQDEDLDSLIESLVDMRFPTEALSYWIKAIPYNNNDSFTFNAESQLPLTLSSHYNGHNWLIKYSSYQTIQKGEQTIAVPNKIKITSADLTINIAINHWTI
ncbi:lipoprotein insertase outer membrane protein LolB [Pseudocolwellia sp. HL-MZ19]|uniref:lipoprotein insertase outer membrane protein LolB n=1 Tax=Pseudocolwellia sp. HL-MZ19 TaxID=3400846 RepID=UPI003CE77D21